MHRDGLFRHEEKGRETRMELWQAILVGFLGTFGVNRTPWFFGFAGAYNGLGAPLVACSIMGIIFGNIPLGLAVGASMEAIFLGQITPGGAMPSDRGFAVFIGGSLAIATGGGVEVAIALAVPLALLGVVLFQAFMTFNIFFAHMGEKAAQRGDGEGVARANIVAAFPTMIVYTAIYAAANYFGVDVVQAIIDALPQIVMDTLSVAAGVMPVVGFAMLLKFTVVKGKEWLLAFFAMGFVLTQATGMGTVSLVLLAIGVALLFISPKLLDGTLLSDNGSKEVAAPAAQAALSVETIGTLDEEGDYEE